MAKEASAMKHRTIKTGCAVWLCVLCVWLCGALSVCALAQSGRVKRGETTPPTTKTPAATKSDDAAEMKLGDDTKVEGIRIGLPASSRVVGWQQFVHEDSGAHILLPATPRTQRTGARVLPEEETDARIIIRGNIFGDPDKIRSTRVVSAVYGSALVVLKFYENSKPEKALPRLLNLITQRQTFVRDITLDERQGKFYLEGGEGYFSHIRYFTTRRHIVSCEVTSREEQDAVAKAIIQSLRFGVPAPVDASLPALATDTTEASAKPVPRGQVTLPSLIRFKSEPFDQRLRLNLRVMVTQEIKLGVVLAASGEITAIRLLGRTHDAPPGDFWRAPLDKAAERIIAATRELVFLPAIKDDRVVTEYAVLTFRSQIGST